MPSWLPAIRYPPTPQHGYWEPVTSTINWCEEDYYATIYSAEIVNTLTNLLFLALGVRGIRNVLKYGHDKVYIVAFLGYTVVGTGSFLFHSTLKCMDSFLIIVLQTCDS
jgi:dihydroceramidase